MKPLQVFLIVFICCVAACWAASIPEASGRGDAPADLTQDKKTEKRGIYGFGYGGYGGYGHGYGHGYGYGGYRGYGGYGGYGYYGGSPYYGGYYGGHGGYYGGHGGYYGGYH